MNESSLSALTDTALKAFASDVSYAVAVVSAAVGIKKKRRSWQLKSDLKSAETEARKLCSQSSSFICMTQSPCGVGSCKFAKGEFSLIAVPKCKGNTERPQRFNTGGNYSLEAALIPLSQLRDSIIK